jgi:hypothetical protein
MATHRLKYDAYRVGDRLLDGVSFAVSLEIEGRTAEIVSVEPWSEEDASYLESVNFERFKRLTVEQLRPDIDYLTEFYGKEGLSFEEAMAEFEEETGEPGVQLFVEV